MQTQNYGNVIFKKSVYTRMKVVHILNQWPSSYLKFLHPSDSECSIPLCDTSKLYLSNHPITQRFHFETFSCIFAVFAYGDVIHVMIYICTFYTMSTDVNENTCLKSILYCKLR